MTDIIVMAVFVIIAALCLRSVILSHKNGKGCGCGCSSCAMSGSCPSHSTAGSKRRK